MFYAFIGVGQSSQVMSTGVTFGAYFLASMAVYAVANVMIFSFGISVATERGMKMDVLMRATPMPPAIFLLSKCITAIAFAALTLVVLFPFAYIAGGVRLDVDVWATLAYRVLLGSIPFIALGFAIGYLSGPNSAVAVINLIYLPTAFASGLFFPQQLLPHFIQQIAPYLPLHFFGQLGWDAIGAPNRWERDERLALSRGVRSGFFCARAMGLPPRREQEIQLTAVFDRLMRGNPDGSLCAQSGVEDGPY